MASKRSLPKVDVGVALQRFSEQFRGLNPNDPSVWPAVPRYALCLAVTAFVLVALWFVWLTNSNDELEAERGKEVTLKADYQKKVAQAANLDLLKKQREQVQQYVTLLEKQLPSKAEMDALLSDINQAGLGRSLQFELFRPGQVVVKDYYAELPIAVRVTGKYHDMGAFVADVAGLSHRHAERRDDPPPEGQGHAADGRHGAHLPLSRRRRAGRPEARCRAKGEEMKVAVKVLVVVLIAAGLSACDSDQEDLQRWMAEQRAQVKPSVPRITEPKKFTPQTYTEASSFEPFNMLKLTQALRRESNQPSTSELIAPELARRKEALEAFPLDSMAMVGSMNRNGQPVALVRVDKLLYKVRVGEYLGLNYGRITRINETEVGLREIVQDAAGEWIERVATLQLQESAK